MVQCTNKLYHKKAVMLMKSPFRILSPEEHRFRGVSNVVTTKRKWKDEAKGVQSDKDVDDWMRLNCPNEYASMLQESRSIYNQKSLESVVPQYVMDNVTFSNTTDATYPVSTSWLITLFPDCGTDEICDIIKPVLPETIYLTIRYSLREGLPIAEISRLRRIPRMTLFQQIPLAKKFIYDAIRAGRIKVENPSDDFDIECLMQNIRGINNSVRIMQSSLDRKTVKVYACEKCSRHLTMRNVDHDKQERGKERVLRCPCGARYAQSQWGKLIC